MMKHRHPALTLWFTLGITALGCGKRAESDLVADDGSAPARIQTRGEIIYPDAFPYTRGKVGVLVTIDIHGNVSDSEIVEAAFDNPTNSELFVEAARLAAETTTFTPSLAVGGYPQTSKYLLNYYFKRSHAEEFDPKDASKFDLAAGQNVDVPPKLLHAGFARRPLEIWQDTGRVELEILVDEYGHVYGTRILSSTLEGGTAEIMHRRVREAALRHVFEPALRDSVPVPCRLRNTVTFEPVTDVYPE